MVIQIGGILILTTCIICGTWYMVTLKQMQTKAAQDNRKRREARNERIYNCEAMSLYEDEKQRRIAAETRTGIFADQLKRAREQMSKMYIKEGK